jgi:Ca2+-binding RTX toxin-like protein
VSDGNNNPNDYYDTRSWTATDLRRELLGQRHDLVFLAGHFSANDALAADYRTNVLTTELAAATVNLANSIVFSAGCHAGYNIVNGDATSVTQPLDWAQAFAQKRATLIAGTGYQYGDTDFIAHSERLYVNLAQELGGAIGGSLLRAKQRFLEDAPGLSALDEKSLLQTTLFGLPMLGVNVTPAPPPGELPAVSPSSVGGGPGGELGLASGDVSVSGPSGDPSSKTLNGLTGSATWFGGTDGLSLKPMQPVLPLESLNATVPGTALRGALFLGGSYQDSPNTTPLTAAPATELRGIHSRYHTDVFFPPQPWTVNYFGALSGSGSTQLHVTPVQHRSESATMTRRKFNGMNFRLFYSSNTASYCGDRGFLAPCPSGQIASTPALSAPPTISNVDTTFGAGVLTFSAKVVGDNLAGIQGVWVTHTTPPAGGNGPGVWQSILLQQDDDDPTLLSGTLNTTTPGAIDFMVQAVSGVGKVTLDTNVGAFYRHGSLPGPPDPGQPPPTATSMAFAPAPPSQVRYGATFNVTVDLDGSAACIGTKPVSVDLGGVSLPGTTNANGTATVAMQAAVLPGVHPITATFAGTPTCASSDAAATVEVVKQQTSLSLALPVVTLTTSPSPQTPLHDRTVIVTVLQGTTPKLVFVGRTDPQGRVFVPQSLLATLAQGGYTMRADYAGETGYTSATVSGGSLNVIRRGAGNDVINGTPGHDLIIDAGGNNTINGAAGNDTIIVQGIGNNVVNGSAGHDTITTGGGNDSIQGGDGDDAIDAGSGLNTVNAGAGNDTITTGGGNDSIQGGDGNDTVSAGNGNNAVNAGSGNDFITTGSGNDAIDGGAGFDFCSPGGGSNTVRNCEG